jgi:hypothetical protein
MEEGNGMTIEFLKQTPAQNENGEPVMLWKFIDQNGNLWNTETPIDGTEDQAKQIILQSIANNG